MRDYMRQNRYFLMGLIAGAVGGAMFGVLTGSIILGTITGVFIGTIGGNIADRNAQYAALAQMGNLSHEVKDTEP